VTRRPLLAGAALAALAAAAPAAAQDQPRAAAVPYIELDQTADADLKSGDVLTYTTVAAGVDASIADAHAQGQVSARYEHRFGETHDLGDQDVYSGLLRGLVTLTPSLSIEGGALATRVRDDIRGEAPGVLAGARANISQLYSLYAGPTFATAAGPVSINAAYRIGYTKVDSPDVVGIVATEPRRDYLDDSLGQAATASIGVAPHAVLPVGVTASGGWFHEDAGQLNQKYTDWFIRDDVLAPVSPYVALAGGVGYEKVVVSQRDALVNAAGAPVLDGNGRFETDPASPRRIAYRTDGVYYDAGIIWRPNRRTSVEAHVGRRYGTMSYTGSVEYQASKSVGFAAQVYDEVTTFGRQLRTGLGQLPTSFIATRDQFAQAFTGCTYGTTGAAPGGCLNGVLQSVTDASYRARGVDAVLSATRGLTSFGVGAGYANRKLYSPDQIAGAAIYGLEDQSWYGDVFLARTLSPASGVDAQAFVNYYEPAGEGSTDVLSVGATATYYHQFGRLETNASLGLYSFRVGDGIETSLQGEAQLGARYVF
jgi:hypothetical protein